MWTSTGYTQIYLSYVISSIPSLSYVNENSSCASLWCIIASKLFLIVWFYFGLFYFTYTLKFLSFFFFPFYFEFHMFIYQLRTCNVLDCFYLDYIINKARIFSSRLFSPLNHCSHSWHHTCVTWVKTKILSYNLSRFQGYTVF